MIAVVCPALRVSLRFAMLGCWCTFLAAATRGAEPTSPPHWTPEQMLQVRRVGSVQVSPNGQLVAFTVREAVLEEGTSAYRTHIHMATADGRQEWPLTQGDKSCEEPQWSPNGDSLAFLTSRSGKTNVWVIRVRGGEAQQFTDWGADVTSFQWSPDGSAIAFTAADPLTSEEERAERNRDDARVVGERPRQQRLHVVSTDLSAGRPKPRTLTTAKWSVSTDPSRRPGFNWSPDSRTLVVSHSSTPDADDWSSADLSLVEMASGAVRPLVASPAAESSPHFSPDGQQIAFVASDNPPSWAGRKRIHVVPASGGAPRALAATADGFGRYSELLGWHPDGQQVYFAELHGTSLRLMRLPLQGDPVVLSELPGMSQSGFALNASRLLVGFSWETLRELPEAWVTPLDAVAPRAVSRIHRDLAQLPAPRTEVIRWKSTDGLEIEGLLTYPHNYRAGHRVPLLVVIHGGPMGAFTQSSDATPNPYPIAAFAARSYAVLRANVRGSSGYGAQFRYANYGDWGGGDFRDLLAGVDQVIEQGVADPDRLGVMGWSYGGYLTSWTITQTQRFRAASVGAGVTNLLSFTGTADIPSFLPDYFGAEFWNHPERYQVHSPMYHVRGVRTPTLIQHGERDLRVPLSQGQELYNALRRQGCPTQMVIYPRTPHGIEEPRLLLDCMKRNLAWFEEHLADPLPQATIRRTRQPVQVDGRLDDAAWQRATVVKLSRFPWWNGGDREATLARLLWDERFLYLSFRCDDAHIAAEHTERDSPVYRDDCVELFTAPNPDQPLNYFNLEMNVRGAYLDQHRTQGPGQPVTPDWNSQGIVIATSIDGTLNQDDDLDRGWVLEAAIPWVNFQGVARHTPPQAGDQWRINLNRLGGRVNPQYSQWSASKTSRPQFHAPEYFGVMTFSDAAAP